jgi:TatD DNase family protein
VTMLVDSHCHLDHARYADDQFEVIGRARDAGVRTMLTIGTRLERFDAVLQLARAHSGVWCSVGVHPHDAEREPLDSPAPLLARTAHPEVVGIGEAGLDYYYQHSSREAQAAGFRAHIQAARESGLPVIVHTRDADADTIRILEEEMAAGPFTGVIHCYSSSPALGFAAAELGLYLGIGGILTFKRSDELRATVARLPLAQLLLETDAPYLAPEPFRGKRNEPAHVARVAATLAQLHDTTIAEIERVTSENFFRLFDKASPPAAS